MGGEAEEDQKEKSVKRDLKDWSITRELALDRREWNLAIYVPQP
jgi:hypothetical protein